MTFRGIVLALGVSVVPVVAPAQQRVSPADTLPVPPPASPADVSSLDAIMKAVYDVISGPAGQPRNWDRMRSMFVPTARLGAVGRRTDGTYGVNMVTLEQYIARVQPAFERGGFFEREISRTAETYGHVTHLFSTYESRRAPTDSVPFARGINSFQLMNDGTRWWVVTIYWQSETPDNPIPARYLPK